MPAATVNPDGGSLFQRSVSGPNGFVDGHLAAIAAGESGAQPVRDFVQHGEGEIPIGGHFSGLFGYE